jgi:hypothetical protein
MEVSEQPPRNDRARRWLLVFATVLLLIGTLAAYLDRNLLQASGFADNVAEAVQSDAVSSRIASTVTNGLVSRDPKLLSVEPVVNAAVRDAVGSSVAGGLIRGAAIQTHNALFSTDQGSIVIDLANLGVVATKLLATRDPGLAKKLRGQSAILGKVADRSWATGLVELAQDVRFLATVLPLLALLCFALAIWIGPRRRAVAGVGISLLAVAAFSFIAVAVLETLVLLGTQPDDRDVVGAILDAFLGGIVAWALVLGIAGAIIAAAATSLAASTDVTALPQSVWSRLTTEPERAVSKIARAVLVIAAGVLAIARPSLVVEIAAALLGAYAVFVGLTWLLILLVKPTEEPAADSGGTIRLAGRRFIAWGLATVAAVALFAAVAALLIGGGSNVPAAPGSADRGCNGFVQLCNRPLDRVALATVHNASSAAPYGVLNANSDLSLTDQLDAGYRGFLIDALLASPNSQGTVRTEITGKTLSILENEVGASGVRSAKALADRLASGPGTGTPNPYLCHVLCELGAIPMADGLKEFADWLDQNPRNVIVLFIQDDITPAEAEQEFSDAGLLDNVSDFDPASGRPWPTLGEMIDSGKNVFVMAENNGEPSGWYHQGFPLIAQDTPYDNKTVRSLQTNASCKLNRGRPNSPLFLVNSWVESYPPNPDNATEANRAGFVLERSRRCARIRDRFPNMVAVDFPGIGDPVEAVDALNGTGPLSRGSG